MVKTTTVLDRPSEMTREAYRPSAEEKEYIMKLRNLFQNAKDARHTPYNLLNNRSLEEYWEDSIQRWVSFIPETRQKDWQSKVVKPITRNKCIGIIANLMSQFIQPDITAARDGIVSEKVADAIGDLVDHSKDLDKYEFKQLLTLVDAVSLGTAFVQEDYVLSERKVKEIKSWDPLTNKTEYEEKEIRDFEGFLSSIISPYEMYLGNIFEFDIQNQPYIFRRVIMPFANAQQKFKKFKDWDKVMPGAGKQVTQEEAEERVFYEAFYQRDLEGDDVEILFYQSRFDDEMAILANGILITEVGSPIPYAHKKYNFTKVVFEPLSPRFAYGKSLPDKLQGEQDVIDTLYRMIIDKTFLSIFPPLLAKGSELITSDIIVPGGITPIDTESDVMVPKGVGNPIGNEMVILQSIESSMDASSIDPQHLGTPATGERSARQVIEAKEGAEKMLSLFGFMIAFAVQDQMDLRIQNILQFWGKHERVVLKDGNREEVRNVFQMKGKDLRGGATGIREIEFGSSELAPTGDELFKQEADLLAKGQKVEKVFLDPDIIRDYQFFVKVKANPDQRMNPALKKALGLEFYDRFIQNPLTSQDKLTRETMKTMDKDPDKYLKSPEEIQKEQQQAQQQAQQEQQQQAGGKPESQNKGNITSQLSAAAQPKLQELINA